MKKLLITLMIAISGFSLAVVDAEARRLGGGGSFGKQSQSVNRAPAQQQAAPNQPAAPAQQARPGTQPGQAAPAAASPWRGLLGGALLGLGLGALLAHFGIGGALASFIAGFLMIALFVFAAVFLYRMLRGKSGNGARPAYAGHAGQGGHYGASHLDTPSIGSRVEPSLRPAAFQDVSLGAGSAPAVPAEPGTIPADFDVPAFVRNAKTYFVRLQAAWDRADINDIREFTSPEMFAELRMQLQERGPSPNHTDVVSLDADVLGVETVGDAYLVSVRFSGLISEAEGAQPEPFTEIWNLSKPLSGAGGWVLAGIQQVS